MVKFRTAHGKGGRNSDGGGLGNLRYIVVLAFLLILFVWMLTLDLEPALALLLAEPEKKEAPCAMESGEIQTLNGILYASDSEGGLLWISHKSDIIEGCRFLSAEEVRKKIPSGIKPFFHDARSKGFFQADLRAFRVLEEAYCQIMNWTDDFGSLNIVSGYFKCSESVDEKLQGTFIFVAVFDQNAHPPRSFSFVWNNEETQKPLSELLVPTSEINRLTGFGIFEDLIFNKEYQKVEELQSILSLGYQASHYEKRMKMMEE
ncbi:MAG: hypothetical protein EA409_05185 [Saprospirales bacterium]|nr:MAG: hypothetical protein EA409_05185 [Saprospirales bacterium]